MSADPTSGWWNPSDLIGAVLDGRYGIVRLLGAGGMGAVYEAEHVALRKRVAIKVLSPELARDPTQVKRFLREAQSASALRHRHVVDIIDFGQAPQGSVFYAMELLEGRDLAQLLREHGRLPWTRARPILRQILLGLRAAHDRGIVHRDVKPANIFLVGEASGETDGVVKVVDFGIAKVAVSRPETRGLTRTDELFGTVAYMSPEQANGVPADARSDVYAVGVVAYELLTGNVPFVGDNAFQVLTRHCNEPPVPLRSLIPTIPAAVEQLVLRALAKRPDDRFQDMAAFEAALAAIDSSGRMGAPSSSVSPSADPIVPPAFVGSTEWLGEEVRPAALNPTMRLPVPPDADERPPSLLSVAPVSADALPPRSHVVVPPEGEASEVASTARPRRDGSQQITSFEVHAPGRRFFGLALALGVAAAVGGGVAAGRFLNDDAPETSPSPTRPEPATPIAIESLAVGPRLEPVMEAPKPIATPPEPSVPVGSKVAVPTVTPSPPPPRSSDASAAVPRKAKSAERQDEPRSDEAILSAMRKRARKECGKNQEDRSVDVAFRIKSTGEPMLIELVGPEAHTAVGKCVKSIVAGGRFGPADAPRAGKLRVEF